MTDFEKFKVRSAVLNEILSKIHGAGFPEVTEVQTTQCKGSFEQLVILWINDTIQVPFKISDMLFFDSELDPVVVIASEAITRLKEWRTDNGKD